MAVIKVKQKDGTYKAIQYMSDGKSAYEIACANGFKGTEQEWLDSLQGKSISREENKQFITSKNYEQLQTNDKTVVGSINEIYDKITNFKFKRYDLFTAPLNSNKIQLSDNVYQVVNEIIIDNTTIVLPENPKELTEIHLKFKTGDNFIKLFFSDPIKWKDDIIIKTNTTYEFMFMYYYDEWLGGYIDYETNNTQVSGIKETEVEKIITKEIQVEVEKPVIVEKKIIVEKPVVSEEGPFNYNFKSTDNFSISMYFTNNNNCRLYIGQSSCIMQGNIKYQPNHSQMTEGYYWTFPNMDKLLKDKDIKTIKVSFDLNRKNTYTNEIMNINKDELGSRYLVFKYHNYENIKDIDFVGHNEGDFITVSTEGDNYNKIATNTQAMLKELTKNHNSEWQKVVDITSMKDKIIVEFNKNNEEDVEMIKAFIEGKAKGFMISCLYLDPATDATNNEYKFICDKTDLELEVEGTLYEKDFNPVYETISSDICTSLEYITSNNPTNSPVHNYRTYDMVQQGNTGYEHYDPEIEDDYYYDMAQFGFWFFNDNFLQVKEKDIDTIKISFNINNKDSKDIKNIVFRYHNYETRNDIPMGLINAIPSEKNIVVSNCSYDLLEIPDWKYEYKIDAIENRANIIIRKTVETKELFDGLYNGSIKGFGVSCYDMSLVDKYDEYRGNKDYYFETNYPLIVSFGNVIERSNTYDFDYLVRSSGAFSVYTEFWSTYLANNVYCEDIYLFKRGDHLNNYWANRYGIIQGTTSFGPDYQYNDGDVYVVQGGYWAFDNSLSSICKNKNISKMNISFKIDDNNFTINTKYVVLKYHTYKTIDDVDLSEYKFNQYIACTKDNNLTHAEIKNKLTNIFRDNISTWKKVIDISSMDKSNIYIEFDRENEEDIEMIEAFESGKAKGFLVSSLYNENEEDAYSEEYSFATNSSLLVEIIGYKNPSSK